MNCPYCKKEVPWVENKEKYGRNYGKSYMCYWCKHCDAYVGCHNNTRKPLGTMANAELRNWRIKAHDYIDTFWKSGELKRGWVYSRLSKQLGKVIHIGESDIETCKTILRTEVSEEPSKCCGAEITELGFCKQCKEHAR